MKTSTPEARRKKRAELSRHYKGRGPFLFLHVHLRDNRSEFSAPLEVSASKEGDDYVVEAYGAVAIANTIAFISEAIDPISIFITLTRRGLMTQAFRYLLFGEGETGLIVYMILLQYLALVIRRRRASADLPDERLRHDKSITTEFTDPLRVFSVSSVVKLLIFIPPGTGRRARCPWRTRRWSGRSRMSWTPRC